jgi:hypothetical protein
MRQAGIVLEGFIDWHDIIHVQDSLR